MEITAMLKEFIKPELIIIVPVLYLIGMAFKHNDSFNNKYIPITLGIISTFLTVLYLLASTDIQTGKDIVLLIFTSLTQGVLLAGASVYINQLKKQHNNIR